MKRTIINIAALLVVLAAFSFAGEADYQDAKRAEVAKARYLTEINADD